MQNFVTERSLWQQDITFKERGAAGGKAAALIGITAWLYYRKIWAVPALIPLGLWLYREFLKEEEKEKGTGIPEAVPRDDTVSVGSTEHGLFGRKCIL